MVLTSRQKDLTRLLLLGRSDQQITEKLGIAVGTVMVHMSSLDKKHRISSRTELILLLFRELCRNSCREIHAFSENWDECDFQKPGFSESNPLVAKRQNKVRKMTMAKQARLALAFALLEMPGVQEIPGFSCLR